MAGMLPGVEAARRRRVHNSYSNSHEVTPNPTCRRPSFCLYATSHDFLPNSSMRNPISHKGLCDDSTLATAAREAKKRLDERFQPPFKSQTKRNCNDERSSRSTDKKPRGQPESQAQLPNLKKSGSKRLSWLKIIWKCTSSSDEKPREPQAQLPNLKKSGFTRLSWLTICWKSSKQEESAVWLEQEECAVCLEQFGAGLGGTLMQLPCRHRFHTKCLVPWLEGHAHCPCCRMAIPSGNFDIK